MPIGAFLRHRGLDEGGCDVQLIEHASGSELPVAVGQHTCFYLQQVLATRVAGGDSDMMDCMEPVSGLGERMRADIAGVDISRLEQLRAAANLGRWRVSQIFVGTAAAAGARSTLHMDQDDNMFVQVAGTKHFRIFPPESAGDLYAYPSFHALDRRAQVELCKVEVRASKGQPARVPWAQYGRVVSVVCAKPVWFRVL